MADGISIAASAVQLADAGFKLYGALSQYIRDYVDANKHVKRLADEVRTTAWALQQLGALLKEDDDIKLCKPEAISETEAALGGCQTAFDEVSEIIKEFLPAPGCTVNDGISGAKRWKWPLKKAKVQLLLAQLERLKTTLLLVFKVLSYASKLASRTVQKDAVLLDEKIQLKYLVRARQDAVKVEERLAATTTHQSLKESLAVKPDTPDVNIQQQDKLDPAPVNLGRAFHGGPRNLQNSKAATAPGERSISDPEYPDTAPSQGLFVHAAYVASRNGATAVPKPDKTVVPGSGDPGVVMLSKRKRRLVAQLDECTAAVERLALALERAKKGLHVDDDSRVHHVTRSFRSTRRAIDELVVTELHADSESATSSDGLSQQNRRRAGRRKYSRSASRSPFRPRSPVPTKSAPIAHRDLTSVAVGGLAGRHLRSRSPRVRSRSSTRRNSLMHAPATFADVPSVVYLDNNDAAESTDQAGAPDVALATAISAAEIGRDFTAGASAGENDETKAPIKAEDFHASRPAQNPRLQHPNPGVVSRVKGFRLSRSSTANANNRLSQESHSASGGPNAPHPRQQTWNAELTVKPHAATAVDSDIRTPDIASTKPIRAPPRKPFAVPSSMRINATKTNLRPKPGPNAALTFSGTAVADRLPCAVEFPAKARLSHAVELEGSTPSKAADQPEAASAPSSPRQPPLPYYQPAQCQTPQSPRYRPATYSKVPIRSTSPSVHQRSSEHLDATDDFEASAPRPSYQTQLYRFAQYQPQEEVPSRSPSPAHGRSRSIGSRARISGEISDQRDYILDFANPEITYPFNSCERHEGFHLTPMSARMPAGLLSPSAQQLPNEDLSDRDSEVGGRDTPTLVLRSAPLNSPSRPTRTGSDESLVHIRDYAYPSYLAQPAERANRAADERVRRVASQSSGASAEPADILMGQEAMGVDKPEDAEAGPPEPEFSNTPPGFADEGYGMISLGQRRTLSARFAGPGRGGRSNTTQRVDLAEFPSYFPSQSAVSGDSGGANGGVRGMKGFRQRTQWHGRSTDVQGEANGAIAQDVPFAPRGNTHGRESLSVKHDTVTTYRKGSSRMQGEAQVDPTHSVSQPNSSWQFSPDAWLPESASKRHHTSTKLADIPSEHSDSDEAEESDTSEVESEGGDEIENLIRKWTTVQI